MTRKTNVWLIVIVSLLAIAVYPYAFRDEVETTDGVVSVGNPVGIDIDINGPDIESVILMDYSSDDSYMEISVVNGENRIICYTPDGPVALSADNCEEFWECFQQVDLGLEDCNEP